MAPAAAIGLISQVLALCGLVSIRMFLPAFLYFLTMRLSLAFPEYAPEMVRQMQVAESHVFYGGIPLSCRRWRNATFLKRPSAVGG